MKKFLIKTSLFFIVVVAIEIVLLQLYPIDKDSYLYEYVYKLDLLKGTNQPRVIIVGGSSVAFNTNSKLISDSLNCNVINFGLHAGIGARMPIQDCLQYIKAGDVIVIQLEYSNFYNGGYGEIPVLTSLMVNKGWWNFTSLDSKQWAIVIQGIPRIAYSNFRQLLKYPFASLNDASQTAVSLNDDLYQYAKGGFNQYGDEVGHYEYPSPHEIAFLPVPEDRKVNSSFMLFLQDMISKFEHAGAIVVMIPPACIDDYFEMAYNEEIGELLSQIGHSFVINPSEMTLSNIYAFDTKYHLNKEGAMINSKRMAKCLKKIKK